MSSDRPGRSLDEPGFPRVSGDEPDYALGAESDTEFSPREWG